MLSKYEFVLPTENSKSLVVCANATCCHKLLLIYIRKYIKQACFANQTCPLKYAAQKYVWINIPTCWNCFNEVFYPEVCRRTCHPILLLMNNAPGYFDPFQMENVVVRFFFTSNVTSWKQPYN